MLAPIIPVLPSFRESFDVSKGDTIFPVSILEFVWKGSEFKLFAKEIEFLVRDGNLEWRLRHCLLDTGMCGTMMRVLDPRQLTSTKVDYILAQRNLPCGVRTWRFDRVAIT